MLAHQRVDKAEAAGRTSGTARACAPCIERCIDVRRARRKSAGRGEQCVLPGCTRVMAARGELTPGDLQKLGRRRHGPPRHVPNEPPAPSRPDAAMELRTQSNRTATGSRRSPAAPRWESVLGTHGWPLEERRRMAVPRCRWAHPDTSGANQERCTTSRAAAGLGQALLASESSQRRLARRATWRPPFRNPPAGTRMHCHTRRRLPPSVGRPREDSGRPSWPSSTDRNREGKG